MTGSPDEERSPAERLRDRPALKSIRSWVAEETDPERLTEWIEAIAQDSRRGARRLAETWDRRRQAVWAERKRLARLFEHRDTLNTQGYRMIAGVDEVGVGPLAGPVVAGAVVLPDVVDLPGLNDSKKLSATARERLAREIRECAVGGHEERCGRTDRGDGREKRRIGLVSRRVRVDERRADGGVHRSWAIGVGSGGRTI